MCLLIAYILIQFEDKKSWKLPYKLFGLYLVLIAIERFLIEFIRINPDVISILSQAQIIALSLMMLGVLLIMSPSIFNRFKVRN